jgi:protein subunit release factor A
MDFTKFLYEETALLFEEGKTKLMAARTDEESGQTESRIRIVHLPTKTKVDVDEFDTQMQNALVARIRLAQKLKS